MANYINEIQIAIYKNLKPQFTLRFKKTKDGIIHGYAMRNEKKIGSIYGIYKENNLCFTRNWNTISESYYFLDNVDEKSDFFGHCFNNNTGEINEARGKFKIIKN